MSPAVIGIFYTFFYFFLFLGGALMASKRVNFAKIPNIQKIPNLLDLQNNSYAEFLQSDVLAPKRKNQGLEAAFRDVFPIANSDGTMSLEYVSYALGEPVYNISECREKGLTYSSGLKAKIKLIVKEKIGEKEKVKEVIEQEIFLSELPLMTETGSFVINGAERVIVSQLHRSPGVIFEEDEEKKISSYGKKLYVARIIPYRGAWVEFEFDINNVIYVRINKKRKLLMTTLLRALGYQSETEILNLFCKTETVHAKDSDDKLLGRAIAEDVVDAKTGEVIAEVNQDITKELLQKMSKSKVDKIKVLAAEAGNKDAAIRNTLKKETTKSKEDAVIDIFKKLRPYDFVNYEIAQAYVNELLFTNPKKYNLRKVGRYKVNRKLGLDVSLNKMTLAKEDIIATIKYLIDLNNNIIEETDDIDHLGNRRVRSVGEMLEDQIRIGLSHMERLIKEKINITREMETITPHDLINVAPVAAIIKKFFGSSQLSQFMDQTNPLAELTHKRRLSALGPGGLDRKRAGFEVRDVHHTHYGRICPIETPEGPNIGLITSLSTFARVNEYGFLETPYRKVSGGVVSDKIEYLTADDEDPKTIAQANAELDANGKFKKDLILSRHFSDFPLTAPKQVDYMDISPMQVVSIAAALIPFLEHDDANRALMGSNMQRQAVPLLFTERPIVGTGLEEKVATDSGAVVVAKREGVVRSVEADKIIIWPDRVGTTKDGHFNEEDIDVYILRKFSRSNQDTCINQKPLVEVGERIHAGQVIADGASTSGGALALGRNLLVAFMPWGGYNFEDAILISEKLVKEDTFSSVHIQEFEIEARELKIRAEEITRDIPNVGEEALRNLDDEGIIRIGAEVRPGDILVGKVTPKGETQLTPEERLLRVIFGEKAEEVQDASLYVPPGVEGKIIDIKIFARREKTKNKGTDDREIDKIEKEYKNEVARLKQEAKKKIKDIQDETKKNLALGKKQRVSAEKIKAEATQKVNAVNIFTHLHLNALKTAKHKRIERLKKGDELPIGINKLVKVYIAVKRQISVGDKIAGRHGNKGVISRVLPEEDMPYLADGTPIEIVLNPLSVPSRMNVGQLLETQLGWAAKALGVEMITPVFDGATEEEVRASLKKAGLPEDSKATLYDGRTGEAFAEKVTTGYMYILKLAHLVSDKIHARSVGPYSLITRQPLGGKAQFGGQRFGEMEVWAIEGYGAAYTLQEFLTVKSDDINGRTKMYESIIKGEIPPPPGIPESFRVLVKELQSLGLNVELMKKMPEKKAEKDN
jgi:DNA-directed RNA polymerase subunit beta